ncbi:MAG: 5'-nucleotidase C-terminal domain-containing protein [Eubacteriales bacterium]|nr:5'-nucleotidase C-terminal domain-containing protein [Eubacteriales bacterium]
MKHRTRQGSWIFKTILLPILALAILSSLFAYLTQSHDQHLVILGTSDMHSDVYGYIYEENRESPNGGAARVYSYIDKVRKANPGATVLVDNGDSYQGNILSDTIYSHDSASEHPMSKFYNYANYDAMVLGNHEFNFGLDFIGRINKELNCPVLAANMNYEETINEASQERTPLAKPYTVIERQGIKIGILGITNPNIPRWEGDKVDSVIFQGIAETAAKYVPILRNKEGCDLVLVSVHDGLNPEYNKDGKEDGVVAMLNEVDGIDLVMLGHKHESVAKRIKGVPAGMPTSYGRQLVRFDVELTKQAGKWRPNDTQVSLVDMNKMKPSAELRKLVQADHQRTLDFIYGASGTKDSGVLAYATADFQPRNEIRGLPVARLEDTALVDLIAKVQLQVSGADVTSVALFKDSAGIAKGPIDYTTPFNVYKFDNTLYTVEVTGRELKAYMEWSAAYYNTWQTGDISISFNKDRPGYLYDMFEGVDYEIDLSKAPGKRIQNVSFKGQALQDDQVLTLAVNDYRYSATLKAQNLVKGNYNWVSPLSIREYLAQYLAEQGEINPEVNHNWRIVGVDLEHELRDEIINLVNQGYLPTPYEQSLNIKELEKEGVIVGDQVRTPTHK